MTGLNMHNAYPPSTLWAETFVAALTQAGLRQVVISPGSRSTPLALAFARREEVHRYTAIDERGAAFFALGLALSGGEPAALVCTSGTATAEYYPAILEAEAACIPLLVLTADRPHELRHSGANQTSDQVKMYGGHVRWFVDVALPESNPAPRTLRSLRTLAARALAVARGLDAPAGAVHLNFPFRKPLSPPPEAPAPEPPAAAQTLHIWRGVLQPSPAQVEQMADLVRHTPRGLILCGPRTPGGDFPAALGKLSQASGYPVLAEALSGVRFGSHVNAHILGGYETYLAEMPAPQVVLRFGALPVGKAALTFLNNLPPGSLVAHVSADGRWQDESHRLSHWLQADPAQVCQQVSTALAGHTPDTDWLCAWQEREAAFREQHAQGMLPALLQCLPQESNLFVANSLAVRLLGEQTPPLKREIRVFANRGLSGIDGTIASAAGVASQSGRPTLLLIGDLAFLHDLNSLHLLRHIRQPFVILLMNNDGGGIFERLPIAAHEPPYTELFRMPHGLTFAHAARQFGLAYTACSAETPIESLLAGLQSALHSPRPHLIEMRKAEGRMMNAE